MIPLRRGVCSDCCAPMLWAITRTGKAIPLDREPVASGNIAIDLDTGVAWIVGNTPPPSIGAERYVSHFVTCPSALKFRGRK